MEKLLGIIEKRYHDKYKFDFYCVIPEISLEKPEYLNALTLCQTKAGWYCRAWAGVRGGFAFKLEENAKDFLSEFSLRFASLATESIPEKTQETSVFSEFKTVLTKTRDLTRISEKLEKMVESLDKKCKHFFANREENTPKRRREAGNMRMEGYHHKEAKTCICNLIKNLENDSDFDTLTIKESLELTHPEYESGRGYYDCLTRTGKYHDNSERAIKFRSYLDAKSSEETQKVIENKNSENKIKGLKIPGYFRRPDAIADILVEKLNPKSNERVLDFGCGDGSLLLALRRAGHPQEGIFGIEINSTLGDYARDVNNFIVMSGADGLDISNWPVDIKKVIINPPFERLQDVDFVKFAYDNLPSDGVIVAIMSPAWKTNSFKKAELFREFLQDIAHEWEMLPEKSFKEVGTAVNCGILQIWK